MTKRGTKPIIQQKDKKSQVEILMEISEKAKYFCDELEQPYASVEINGCIELMKADSREYKDWLTMKFFHSEGKSPSSDSLAQAIGTIKALAKFSSKKYTLHKRVAEKNDCFYYDLCDEGRRAVKITKDGCKILKKTAPLFVRTTNMKEQVRPDFKGDIQLLRNHLRLVKESDWILCFAYLATCLIPNIPHPVLVIAGEKGAAKSTTLRMIKAIVDPAHKELLAMPNSKNDLALSLANNYMPCFDNLDKLSAEKSDVLCMASTGGGISKRLLYSNDEEVILSFKRCVGMNGINIVATRADLLDRAVILELRRISEKERKEESVIWEEFRKDLPQIVGGVMTALSKAMKIYPEVKLERLSRMADFTKWGYAFAEAVGIGGENFLEAYRKNQSYANEEAIESHPVAAALVALMSDNEKWRGSVRELLENLEEIANKEKINTNSEIWPKAPHSLSRRLTEIKSNLEQKGIIFSKKHAGDAKIITIVNKNLQKEK